MLSSRLQKAHRSRLSDGSNLSGIQRLRFSLVDGVNYFLTAKTPPGGEFRSRIAAKISSNQIANDDQTTSARRTASALTLLV
jgi:hypothetical protein